MLFLKFILIFFTILGFSTGKRQQRHYCYKCLASNKKRCEEIQVKYHCPKDKDVCVSLQYTDESYVSFNQKQVTTYYKKTCGKSRRLVNGINCDRYCERKLLFGRKTCTITECCPYNYCNNGKELANRNRRRNSSGKYYNSSNMVLPRVTVVISFITLLVMLESTL